MHINLLLLIFINQIYICSLFNFVIFVHLEKKYAVVLGCIMGLKLNEKHLFETLTNILYNNIKFKNYNKMLIYAYYFINIK